MTKMRLRFRVAIIISCLMSAMAANAMPRLGREGTGSIQLVDANHHMFTIRLEGEIRPRSFEWTRDTRFFEGYALTTSRTLRAGAAVRIYYHVPFFGKPYVTKVTFLTSPQRELGMFGGASDIPAPGKSF